MTPGASTLQLAELLNYVEDVLAWVKDRDGRFLWVNRANMLMHAAGGRMNGAADVYSEILGKTDHDLAPAVLADQYQLDDDHVLAGNRIVNRIEPFRRPDGSTCWHVTTKIPLLDDAGRVIGTAGVARLLKAEDSDAASGNEFGPVLAYMRDQYQTPITNDTLAKLAHMSVRAFERKFRKSFNLSPQKYLRGLRVRIASHALVYTKQPLSEVALACGFADQSHFTREFRRHFGRTPREYRAHYSAGSPAALSTKDAAREQEAAAAGPDHSNLTVSAESKTHPSPKRRRRRSTTRVS
jgi:AraC-like DNA-binding protein